METSVFMMCLIDMNKYRRHQMKYSSNEGNSVYYGVRSSSHLLLAMNNGMRAASLLEIQDQHWPQQCYGLVDRNDQTVNNMVVLQTFLKE